ncbi:MAG: hypothetical protein IPN18_15485 [Ignavibacteriales bacterium]|nr:hypothetical protein [Ignavibacteriales bacterium]
MKKNQEFKLNLIKPQDNKNFSKTVQSLNKIKRESIKNNSVIRGDTAPITLEVSEFKISNSKGPIELEIGDSKDTMFRCPEAYRAHDFESRTAERKLETRRRLQPKGHIGNLIGAVGW